ncbi:MAG: DUF2726 domain-containing protein [Burkholderiaceae bacterium]
MKLTLLLLLGAALLGLAAFLVARLKSAASDGPWPFVVRKPMTVPEQVLYFRLLEALPEHIVLAQVQLSRFLTVKRGQSSRGWLNRVNRLSVDFLILKKDATVVAAVELDDKTHQRTDRREADSRKNRALSDAGVRLVRWNVGDMPSASTIRVDIARPQPEGRPASAGGRIEPVLVARVRSGPS